MFLKNLEIIAQRMSKSLFERTSWEAMLNMIKVEIQFISDPNMYIFFKKVREVVEFLIFLIEIVKPTISD